MARKFIDWGDEKPTLRYQSTGRPVFPEKEESEEEKEARQRERLERHPYNQREKALQKLWARRDAMEPTQEQIRDGAAAGFKARNKDLLERGLLPHVCFEGQQLINRRQNEGKVVEWNGVLDEAAAIVREKVGMQSVEEVERQEALTEMRLSRGKFLP